MIFSWLKRSANRRVCSRPSSESATSVAPAKRSSALSTVAPWRTMKTRVTADFIIVDRHRVNSAKRQSCRLDACRAVALAKTGLPRRSVAKAGRSRKTSESILALDFGQRGGDSEKENRQQGHSNRRSNSENVHDQNH